MELPFKYVSRGPELNQQKIADEDEWVEEILREEQLVEEYTSIVRGNHVQVEQDRL